MTDKATPTLRQRCDTALQSLPDAPYKTMLAVLFDDMTAEVERLAAQAAPSVDSWTREDVDEVISCLEDDSAALKNENEEDERAANMDRAGSMLAWMLLTHPVYRAQPSQAPVVLAVQPEYCTGCDMTSNDKQRCEDCPRRASSGATTQAVRMLTGDQWKNAKVADRGFEYTNGQHIPHVLVTFDPADWDSRDAFAEFVRTGRTIPPNGEIGGV